MDPIPTIPLGANSGCNHLFLYAKNNPINRIDVFGLLDCPVGQHPEVDWDCVLTIHGIGSPVIVPVWLAVPVGVTVFVAGGPAAWAGAGLAIAAGGILGAIEGTVFSGCSKCVSDEDDFCNQSNPPPVLENPQRLNGLKNGP